MQDLFDNAPKQVICTGMFDIHHHISVTNQRGVMIRVEHRQRPAPQKAGFAFSRQDAGNNRVEQLRHSEPATRVGSIAPNRGTGTSGARACRLPIMPLLTLDTSGTRQTRNTRTGLDWQDSTYALAVTS